MTMIVGYAPDARGQAVLHLAAMLARSAGDDLLVCSVVPAPWLPGMARVDAEYQGFLDTAADQALETAKALLTNDIPVTVVRHHARSTPAGLLELASEHGSNLVVLGSSSHGSFGHVALGSVTDRLLHSSPVSIALAPRGFRTKPDAVVTRVTLAYGGSAVAESLVVGAGAVAAQVGASLRIASFAVWSRPSYVMRLGTEDEGAVLQEWMQTIQKTANDALEQVTHLTNAPRAVETVIGRGASWSEALEDVPWDEGDVLVVGSSELGPLAQVFLGSRATKIVRHSPVPVVVVPRGRAEELADKAVEA